MKYGQNSSSLEHAIFFLVRSAVFPWLNQFIHKSSGLELPFRFKELWIGQEEFSSINLVESQLFS